MKQGDFELFEEFDTLFALSMCGTHPEFCCAQYMKSFPQQQLRWRMTWVF